MAVFVTAAVAVVTADGTLDLYAGRQMKLAQNHALHSKLGPYLLWQGNLATVQKSEAQPNTLSPEWPGTFCVSLAARADQRVGRRLASHRPVTGVTHVTCVTHVTSVPPAPLAPNVHRLPPPPANTGVL